MCVWILEYMMAAFDTLQDETVSFKDLDDTERSKDFRHDQQVGA